MLWFKIYNKIADDRKIAALSIEAVGVWVLVLAIASRSSPRGTLPSDMEDLAFMIHRPVEMVKRAVAELVAAKMLTLESPETISIYKWESYQAPSTERTAAYKDAKKIRDREQMGTKGTSGNKGNKKEPLELELERELEKKLASQPLASHEDHQTCVVIAMELFGDQAANAITASKASIETKLGLVNAGPRAWDCFAAGLKEVSRRSKQPGSDPIRSVVGFALSLAEDYVIDGIPPEPVRIASGTQKAAEPIDRDKYVYKPDFVQNPKKAEYEARFVKAAALRDQWSREGMNYDDAFDKACLECNVNRPGGRRRA